jgi:hypothetical protein
MERLRDARTRLESSIVIAVLCTAAVLAAAPCNAASIPAWLDDAITSWNGRNPGLQFQFAGIKDSFVWYRIPGTPEIGQKEIRGAAYKLLQEHGYTTMDDEELVTTGRPPTDGGPSTPKKCWRRSFVRTLDNIGNTTEVGGEHAGIQQRLLTSMVCEEGPTWATGFRVSD